MRLIVRISRQILHLKFFFFDAEIMMNMGYSRKEIEDSLSQNKYDDITATYLLLGRRTMEVSSITIFLLSRYLRLCRTVKLFVILSIKSVFWNDAGHTQTHVKWFCSWKTDRHTEPIVINLHQLVHLYE